MSSSDASRRSTDSKSKLPKKQLTTGERNYLVAYNALSFAAWFSIFVVVCRDLYASDFRYEHLYDKYGWPLIAIQPFTVLEVIHAYLGLVQSGVFTTLPQVFSRLFITWGILFTVAHPNHYTHWSFAMITVSWSLTESIRYSYYALNLLDIAPYALLWARYTLFIILYPIGLTGELFQITLSLPHMEEGPAAMYYFSQFMLLAFPVAFTRLYLHMFSQRGKALKRVNDNTKTEKAAKSQ
ncbi:PTPLA-domain-containing protein [Ramicandelaber brevisporus]|nr:PTPLA-domain-containing protein [Ramicandelaber brevisporus]